MKHLRAMFDRADAVDRREGRLAYSRYHAVMKEIAAKYDLTLPRVVGAFVALSPNSDYAGNLRSLISLLDGLTKGHSPDQVVVSTYRHALMRAWEYANGVPFLSHAKGLKTRAFYRNVLDPTDPEPVTVDGHMMAAWLGQNLTMKEAKVGARDYRRISDAVQALAAEEGMIANQVQATIWFARKRSLQIKYDPQLDLFYGADDQWRTQVMLDEIRPYGVQSIALAT